LASHSVGPFKHSHPKPGDTALNALVAGELLPVVVQIVLHEDLVNVFTAPEFSLGMLARPALLALELPAKRSTD
jgi:hypothetical protein